MLELSDVRDGVNEVLIRQPTIGTLWWSQVPESAGIDNARPDWTADAPK